MGKKSKNPKPSRDVDRSLAAMRRHILVATEAGLRDFHDHGVPACAIVIPHREVVALIDAMLLDGACVPGHYAHVFVLSTWAAHPAVCGTCDPRNQLVTRALKLRIAALTGAAVGDAEHAPIVFPDGVEVADSPFPPNAAPLLRDLPESWRELADATAPMVKAEHAKKVARKATAAKVNVH